MAYSEEVVHKAVRLFTFAKQEIHLDWTLGIDKLCGRPQNAIKSCLFCWQLSNKGVNISVCNNVVR